MVSSKVFVILQVCSYLSSLFGHIICEFLLIGVYRVFVLFYSIFVSIFLSCSHIFKHIQCLKQLVVGRGGCVVANTQIFYFLCFCLPVCCLQFSTFSSIFQSFKQLVGGWGGYVGDTVGNTQICGIFYFLCFLFVALYFPHFQI